MEKFPNNTVFVDFIVKNFSSKLKFSSYVKISINVRFFVILAEIVYII